MLEISDLISCPSKSQDFALPPHIKYPAILGLDVAGTVVQLGSNVTRFKIGQRVLGYVTIFQMIL
jgi:NADPH:quinone reductase-like Zn-dependent oxidoreductase